MGRERAEEKKKEKERENQPQQPTRKVMPLNPIRVSSRNSRRSENEEGKTNGGEEDGRTIFVERSKPFIKAVRLQGGRKKKKGGEKEH